MFYHYAITSFKAEDIKKFYRETQILSPRADGVRKPSLSQIQKALSHLKNVKNTDESHYEILQADTKVYEKEIKQGYKKNKIL